MDENNENRPVTQIYVPQTSRLETRVKSNKVEKYTYGKIEYGNYMVSTNIHTKDHKNDFKPQIYEIYDELRTRKERILWLCFPLKLRAF